MTERQFEGRSVAEAAIKACEVLGLTRSALRYKVISETGELLNRRVVIAVEASASPAPAPQAEPAQHAHHEDGSADAGTGDSGESAADDDRRPRRSSSGAGGRRSERSSDRGGDRSGRRSERSDRGGDRGDRGGDRGDRGGDRQARGRGGRSRSGSGGRGRDRDRERRPQDDDGIEALLKLDAPDQPTPVRRPAITSNAPRAQKAVTVAGDLVRLMGLKLTAHLVEEQEDELHIDLVGADETRAIGRKGEVLLALQFVTNRIISRGEEEGGQVVVLDAGGYRERRRNALQELARRLATRALEERKAVRLSPMSAHDRRVFHMTLKEMEGVTTRSEGDGLFRNLLIIPSEFC